MSSPLATITGSGIDPAPNLRSRPCINHRDGLDHMGRTDRGADQSGGEEQSTKRGKGGAAKIVVEHFRSP